MMPFAVEAQFGPEELALLHEIADVPEPVHLTELDSPQARARIADAEVIISSWGCPTLDADRLAAAPHLRAVFHAAGTVRGVVSDPLWDRGILVTSAAEENAVPVAEFTLAAIIFAGKKVPFLSAQARKLTAEAHSGERNWFGQRDEWGAMSNLGQTVGIIGYSKIGRQVVALLRPFEMTVLVYDPFADEAAVAAAGATLVGLDELLARSDIVSVHAPELPSTYRMLDADQLALMQDHATLINTARGSLVNTEALAAECVSGRLNAMLDVTDPEPLPVDSPLLDLPNVMVTPHVAGSLGTETRRMSRRALTELRRYAQGLPPEQAVTRADLAVMA